MAVVIYRQRQLALRQARVLRPLGWVYRFVVQPLRGQWRHWRRLLAQLRLMLLPRLHASLWKRCPSRRPSWQRNWRANEEGWLCPSKVTGSHDTAPIGKLVVGLLTYNNESAQLRSCLRALDQAILALQSDCSVEIMILDNGSASVEALGGWQQLRWLEPVGNVGFGAGHNRLMQRAFAEGADAYVAMNPDGRAHPRLLGALRDCSYACRGGAVVEALQFPCEHPKPFDPRHGETPWASGACLLIPRGIYKRIGGFDETFFMYCEDVDLSWRARAAGFRVVTAPKALFLHQVTNREPNPARHALMLAAGRQLGLKWRRPVFALAATLKLKQLGEVADQLPPQTRAKPSVVPASDRWASSFGHAFSFSRPRW